MPGAIFLNALPGSGQRAPCGGRLKTFVKDREEKPHIFFFLVMKLGAKSVYSNNELALERKLALEWRENGLNG